MYAYVLFNVLWIGTHKFQTKNSRNMGPKKRQQKISGRDFKWNIYNLPKVEILISFKSGDQGLNKKSKNVFTMNLYLN